MRFNELWFQSCCSNTQSQCLIHVLFFFVLLVFKHFYPTPLWWVLLLNTELIQNILQIIVYNLKCAKIPIMLYVIDFHTYFSWIVLKKNRLLAIIL